jgi:adenylylsulfate kinase
MKILIMGLPGSGKTWLAERLQKHLECAWYNADRVREMANDWDFSLYGRHRQSNRMRSLADFEKGCGRTVICDFICPTNSTRKIFDPDITIWLDTINSSRFEDTNKLFEKPTNAEYHFTHWLSDKDIEMIGDLIKNV